MSSNLPRDFRAEHISDDDMRALGNANGKIVIHQGQKALLKLDATYQGCNVVELHFDQVGYEKDADGDYSEILNRLGLVAP